VGPKAKDELSCRESLVEGQDEVGADCMRHGRNWAGYKPAVRASSISFWKRNENLKDT